MIQEIKNIGHFFETYLWRFWYGRPDVDMYVYGVTGTNGKTTTSYLLTSILEHAHGKERVGMLTTVSFRVDGVDEINTSKITTMLREKIVGLLKPHAPLIGKQGYNAVRAMLDRAEKHGIKVVRMMD